MNKIEQAYLIIKKYSTTGEQINNDTILENLAIDSLAFVSLMVELEKLFQVELSDDSLDFSVYDKVEDIIKVFINWGIWSKIMWKEDYGIILVKPDGVKIGIEYECEKLICKKGINVIAKKYVNLDCEDIK